MALEELNGRTCLRGSDFRIGNNALGRRSQTSSDVRRITAPLSAVQTSCPRIRIRITFPLSSIGSPSDLVRAAFATLA
jgi:hypothetical protein